MHNCTGKLVINIDGNIGAGKSSFIRRLMSEVKNLKIHVIEENVDRDEESRALLQNYYRDPKTHALEFQQWILRDKAEQLAKIHDEYCVIIFDRSFMADHHVFCLLQHQLGNITDSQYHVYCQEYEQIVKLTEKALNIYIHSTVETCHKRIAMRAREGESKISKEYLKKLQDGYDKLYRNIVGINIDGNGTMKEMDKNFERVFELLKLKV